MTCKIATMFCSMQRHLSSSSSLSSMFRSSPQQPSGLKIQIQMDVSENSGTPKSSILIGFSIINHPFWGKTPIFGNIQMDPISAPQQLSVALEALFVLASGEPWAAPRAALAPPLKRERREVSNLPSCDLWVSYFFWFDAPVTCVF